MFTKETSLIIGSKHSPVKTRSNFSVDELIPVDEALTFVEWNIVMQEELNQF